MLQSRLPCSSAGAPQPRRPAAPAGRNVSPARSRMHAHAAADTGGIERLLLSRSLSSGGSSDLSQDDRRRRRARLRYDRKAHPGSCPFRISDRPGSPRSRLRAGF